MICLSLENKKHYKTTQHTGIMPPLGSGIRGTAAKGPETNFDAFWVAAGQSYPPTGPVHLNPIPNATKTDPKWAEPTFGSVLAACWDDFRLWTGPFGG